MTDRARLGVAVVALLLIGALMPLAFAPFGWWLVALPCITLLFYCCARVCAMHAALFGFVFGVGMFGAGVSWIHESFQFSNVHGPIVWLLTAGFVAFLSLFPALACWAALYLGQRQLSLLCITLLPSTWLLVEWLRGWALTGFTWLQLGYSQTDGPASAIMPVVGSYGAGALIALSSGALAALVLRRHKGSVIAVASVALVWFGCWAASSINWTTADGPAIQVATIQGNYAQADKWRPENLAPTLKRYRSLTKDAVADGAELVIWPETAIPSLARRMREFTGALNAEAERAGATVVFGIVSRSPVGLHNTVMSVGLGQGIYYKRHLVPFGEYIPFRSLLLPLLRVMQVRAPKFIQATEATPPVMHKHVQLGITICYESAFGSEVSAALPGANVLVNVSNDAWFGDTLAPHQHLQIARTRALETGRPLIRATNTGISAFIAPNGLVTARSPQFKPHVLQESIQPMRGLTPYARYGDWPVVLGMCVLLLVALWRQRVSRVACTTT